MMRILIFYITAVECKNEISEEIFDKFKTTRKTQYVIKGLLADQVITKLFDIE